MVYIHFTDEQKEIARQTDLPICSAGRAKH